MISRGGSVGYQELAAILRERILSGELAPGARMPSENDLHQEYGINRLTARRAIQVLEHEGLVIVRHGFASRVRARHDMTEVAVQRGARWVARMPTDEERVEFDLPHGVPVLEVRYGGRVLVYPADRHWFVSR